MFEGQDKEQSLKTVRREKLLWELLEECLWLDRE